MRGLVFCVPLPLGQFLYFRLGSAKFRFQGCPKELGFMDEPMASRIRTVLEPFFIYSFIFASRFPIYVDSASCTDA